MTPLYTVADNRAIESALFAAMPSFDLMRQAGAAVAREAMAMLPDKSRPLLAIAGGGNNGGDAVIAATRLKQAGYSVSLILAGDAARLPADAAQALAQWREAGGDRLPPDADALPPADLIIDGLFGIGLSRPPAGMQEALIHAVNRHPAPALAIDVPSGLNADTGAPLGSVIKAARTVTFFGGKPGLYTGAGAALAGEVVIAALNAPPHAPSGRLMRSPPPLDKLRRRRDSHKGDYGALALIGGSDGMLGALALAARAAAALGAGKTYAATLGAPPAVDWLRPDVMWRKAEDLPMPQLRCIAAGMGLGTGSAAEQRLAELLACPQPLLIDADGLNLLAKRAGDWRAMVAGRAAATILTPHAAEAARLLGCAAAEINADRPAAAARLAAQWQATVILKGAGTIIQSPGRPFILCAAGNPGLARAGSGDVLSGMVAALLAQTMDAEFAAAAGVWLHAAAADRQAAMRGALAVEVNQLAADAARLAGGMMREDGAGG